MRVLVCGSRDWEDDYPIHCVLNGYAHDDCGPNGPEGAIPLTVINGGARGADRHARSWAEFNEWPCETYLADWDRYGDAAGPIRNKQMLDVGTPDVVWAFVTKPLEHSRGTADMVSRARAAGVPTYVVQAKPAPLKLA